MSFEEWYKENISSRESKIFLHWDVDHYTFPTTQHHYSAYQAGQAEQKEKDAVIAETLLVYGCKEIAKAIRK